ncbi:polysaccharide deacetylase family protein [Paenibacillus contaminans]|nr:polysaccharide deacetylase family protein [Paenibacillus contaminans]
MMRKAFVRKMMITLLCCGLLQGYAIGNRIFADGDEDAGLEAARVKAYEKLSSGQRIEAGEKGVTAAAPTETTVYLTFDDGPSVNTPEVLDILREEEVPATFFVLGEMAERQPDMVKRILAEGHSLGNHSYNHVYKELYGDFGVFWKQLQKTEDALERIAGLRPTLVRAPGGTATNFDAFYFYYLETAGYQVHDWNVDSGDSKRSGVPVAEIVRTVKDSPIRGQTVVLMHDGAGHAETAKALPEIIRFYKDKGVKFAVLTPETKPVQFTLHKPKWSRATSYEQFVKADKEARRSAALKREANEPSKPHEANDSSGSNEAEEAGGSKKTDEASQALLDREKEAVLRHQTEVAVKESAYALEQLQASVPLKITFDRGDWTLEGGEYVFERGSFAVPLRGLAEKLGGAYADGSPGTAAVRLGQRLLVYEAAERAITEYSLVPAPAPDRKPLVRALADVRFANGELYVPLRAAVELFGGRIADYRLERDARFVTVSMREDGGDALFASADSNRTLASAL